MLKTLLLVCAAQVAPQDCTTDNALTVIRGPDASNELMCMRDGQAYLAATVIPPGPDEYLRILCIRPGSLRQADKNWDLD